MVSVACIFTIRRKVMRILTSEAILVSLEVAVSVWCISVTGALTVPFCVAIQSLQSYGCLIWAPELAHY